MTATDSRPSVTETTITKYYYAGASRIAMSMNGTVYYLLSDQLGSTTVTTDAQGGFVSELRYDAWGSVRYTNSTTPTDYTYTGQYSNVADFGLMYYNARWYDPYLNRWTQPDTIVPDASNPQSWDRYSYALNNPLRYIDPSGHKPCWATAKYSCNLTQDIADREYAKYGDKDKPAVAAFFASHGFRVATGNAGTGAPSSSSGGFSTAPGHLVESWWWGGYSSACSYTDYYSCGNQSSNRLPDYISLNLGGSIPGLGTLISGQLAITVDRFGNLYLGPGVALGPEAPLGFSASLSGGYISSLSGLAPGKPVEGPPGEQRSEQILSGWYANGIVCLGLCGGATASLKSPYIGMEVLGIGVPQLSVGAGYSFLLDFTPNSGVPIWR